MTEGVRREIVSKISVECLCGWEHVVSNPYSREAKGLNRKSVFGSRLIGKGRSGIETISALLDLPPPVVDSAYSDHNKEICQILSRFAESEKLAAVARLQEACEASPDDILDVSVTFDGTWSKRGFTL